MKMNKMAKDSMVYSLTAILVQAVNLLLVPIFTINMTQEQYGEYNLLIAAQTLLAIIITVSISSGINRFLYEFEDQNRIKNVVLSFSMIWGLFLCLITYFMGHSFSHLLAISSDSNSKFYLDYLVFSSVFLGLINIYISYYTMLMKPRIVSVINLSRTIFLVILSAYTLIILKAGVNGALLAQLLSYAVVLMGLLWYDRKTFSFVLSWQELKKILNYSLGLIPGLASSWVYTLIDRYFLNIMVGLKQVAVYSLGYKIGMLMDPVLITSFKSVFTSFKYRKYKDPNAKEKFREIYIYYNFIGLLCVLGLSVFAKPLILLLSTPEYIQAFKVVPLIAFSYFIYGLGEFYSLGIHLENKSLTSSLILAFGALTNIGLNYLLIPGYGYMGAAAATIVSYFIMNLITYFIGKKYYDCGINYLEPFKGIILTFILYLIYFATYRSMNGILLEMTYAAFICILYIAVSVFTGLLPREASRMLYKKYLKPLTGGKNGDSDM